MFEQLNNISLLSSALLYTKTNLCYNVGDIIVWSVHDANILLWPCTKETHAPLASRLLGGKLWYPRCVTVAL